MVFVFYQKQLLSTMTSAARDGVKNGIPNGIKYTAVQKAEIGDHCQQG